MPVYGASKISGPGYSGGIPVKQNYTPYKPPAPKAPTPTAPGPASATPQAPSTSQAPGGGYEGGGSYDGGDESPFAGLSLPMPGPTPGMPGLPPPSPAVGAQVPSAIEGLQAAAIPSDMTEAAQNILIAPGALREGIGMRRPPSLEGLLKARTY